MQPFHRRLSTFLLASGAALVACGGPLDEPRAPAGSAEQPIINGSTTNSLAGNSVDFAGLNCSAVALDEEWVVTAKHCTVGGTWSSGVFTPDMNKPLLLAGSSTAHRVSPSESRVIREIHRHPSLDLALLRVHPFSTVSRHIEPWGSALSGLSGKSLYCVGQGYNAMDSGSGTWRSATMVPSSIGTDGYTFVPNGSGQIQWMGDSGGPCTYFDVGGTSPDFLKRAYLTGIQSYATFTCAPGTVTCDAAHAQTVTSVFQVGLDESTTGWLKDIQQRAPLSEPGYLYGLASDGALRCYVHNGYLTGAGLETPGAWGDSGVVGSGWTMFQSVFSAGGATYGIHPDGRLFWYRHSGFSNCSFSWQGPRVVGSGWQSFKQVFGMTGSSVGGVIYGIAQDGTLYWYRHAGYVDGTSLWNGARAVGSGWNAFKSVFSGGDGVIYALKEDGTLLWYRHTGWTDGSFAWEGPRVVGSGWAAFRNVFAGGDDGIVYAVRTDGALLWYKHRGLATGTSDWEGPRTVGTGWSFRDVFLRSSEPAAIVR